MTITSKGKTMKNLYYQTLLLFTLFLGLLAPLQAANTKLDLPTEPIVPSLSNTDYVPGRVIVKFRDGTQNNRKRSLRNE